MSDWGTCTVEDLRIGNIVDVSGYQYEVTNKGPVPKSVGKYYVFLRGGPTIERYFNDTIEVFR